MANYIGMTSGQYLPCEVHNDLPEHCHQDVNNVFHQMDAAGLSYLDGSSLLWQSGVRNRDLAPDAVASDGAVHREAFDVPLPSSSMPSSVKNATNLG